MATQVQRPSINGAMPRKPSAPGTRAPVKKAGSVAAKQTPAATRQVQQKAAPVTNKAQSVAGYAGEATQANGVSSAYAIMASRIANRVAEMAESITFVER